MQFSGVALGRAFKLSLVQPTLATGRPGLGWTWLRRRNFSGFLREGTVWARIPSSDHFSRKPMRPQEKGHGDLLLDPGYPERASTDHSADEHSPAMLRDHWLRTRHTPSMAQPSVHGTLTAKPRGGCCSHPHLPGRKLRLRHLPRPQGWEMGKSDSQPSQYDHRVCAVSQNEGGADRGMVMSAWPWP